MTSESKFRDTDSVASRTAGSAGRHVHRVVVYTVSCTPCHHVQVGQLGPLRHVHRVVVYTVSCTPCHHVQVGQLGPLAVMYTVSSCTLCHRVHHVVVYADPPQLDLGPP